MTNIERNAVIKISRDLCLSCANNPSIEEYPAEYGGGEVPNEMRLLADRIEAAWNRREICDLPNLLAEVLSNQSCLVLATPINITRGLLAEVVE